MTPFNFNLSPAAALAADPATAPAKRLTATQRLVSQPTYTRSQMLPGNFTAYIISKQLNISEATTVPQADLIAMLDRDHAPGTRFAVVCKNSTRSIYVTTVFDLKAKRFYRATSMHSVRGLWKDVARRRGEVQLLAASEDFEG